jgi:hypothetical protein
MSRSNPVERADFSCTLRMTVPVFEEFAAS